MHNKYDSQRKKRLQLDELTDNMAHPVGINARMLANKSATDRSVKATTRQSARTRDIAVTPCKNLNKS